jgi:uncharacterized membrane protein YcaP (DUF421 family)
METVLRGAAVYVVLLVVFRIAGKRSLAEVTTFDFVLLLILSECVQNALVGQDYSLTTGLLAVFTLVAIDVIFSHVKGRSPRIERWLDGLPVVIVEEGRPFHERMKRLGVDEDDVLEAAHVQRGLGRMEEIGFAILERSGEIAVIPRSP